MLTAERVRELLEYLPDSGLLIWRVKSNKRFRVGQIAGCLHNVHGYIEIRIDGKSYRAHRLAWLLMTGEWPKHQIDHVNLDASDNRWCNIREATHNQNMANRAVYGKSGVKGVTAVGKKWMARITIQKRSVYLGLHDTPEQAHAAYCEAAREHYGEYARFN